MNSITDLTARAVSFITMIQTVLLNGAVEEEKNEKLSILTIAPEELIGTMERFIFWKGRNKITSFENLEKDHFGTRAIELVWVSNKTPDVQVAIDYTLAISKSLVKWIQDSDPMKDSKIHQSRTKYPGDDSPEESAVYYGSYPTPFIWREVIRKILCQYPKERVHLANALQYLPIRIVLALSGKKKLNPQKQRILQLWNVDDKLEDKLLNTTELNFLKRFRSKIEPSTYDTLLTDEKKLIEALEKAEVPFSFETIFKSELEEIRKNRYWRLKELRITEVDQPIDTNGLDKSEIIDPLQKADEMKLHALALSGGGIRSATFNLGVLQGLAKHNILSKFDYLSTVSGGGYIGSWLSTWIKRDQSFVKVTNRLCPEKSPEPLGEELKPIRWLRMFSNYFAPNASIMSADAWTIGVTWLRNTLLNQTVIFSLLLGLIFIQKLLYQIWFHVIKGTVNYSLDKILWTSSMLLIPVSILAGAGMHAYHSRGMPWLGFNREGTKKVSRLILIVAIIGSFLLSAWMSSEWEMDHSPVAKKLGVIWPVGIPVFIALLIVAYLGKYNRSITEFKPNFNELPKMERALYIFVAIFFLIITAAVAAGVAIFCLVAMWETLAGITSSSNYFIAHHINELQFIIGFPIALEVFSIVVVVRMAFLGKYFPDERREWWGRMGGLVHRVAFLWVCISTSALLGADLVIKVFKEWALPAAGGWAAMVLWAVKAAYSAKTSGKDSEKKSTSYLNILSLVGPYIFILGLLIFLPRLIGPIQGLVETVVNYFAASLTIPSFIRTDEFQIAIIILLAAIILVVLSWRIGVNEFSMHHFYRNRLVRAYLGASRRSTNRQLTYNPFTGFDMMDDEKLHVLHSDFGYHGPYPVLNAALNASDVVDLDRQDRKAESFIFSPLFCGFDFSMIKASADVKTKSYDHAYRETKYYAFDGGPTIGTAMAISGAAINPNNGYHSSAATAFLLTVFNLQMGWWMGNPRQKTWKRSDPKLGLGQIIYNLIGKTNTRNNYVALSDGGHFDNMGLYEMIRRRCSRIVVCDAEQDEDFTCEGFANAIRRCRIDFGAEIDIDLSTIVRRHDNNISDAHYIIGDIRYADIETVRGKILYIKSSLTDDEPVDVYEYSKKNKTFPQQTTADQFFDEEQFESYRKLGLHIMDDILGGTVRADVRNFFSGDKVDDNKKQAAEKMVTANGTQLADEFI